MNDRNSEIRQANRKALPKFILITLLCAAVGGVVGFCAAWFGLDALAGGLAAAGQVFALKAAPWLMLACAVLRPALCLPPYFSAKKLAAGWDGEDDVLLDRMDGRLTLALWLNTMLNILSFFLFAAVFSAGLPLIKGSGGPFFLLSLAAFLIGLVAGILIEQRLVDLSKRLLPEKEGSVYDTGFQKKWFNSCDEAEKLMIGQCSYKAYAAMNTTCLILWMVFAISAMFLNTGFLPVLTVCVIWAVGQTVYCRWSRKLSSAGAALR